MPEQHTPWCDHQHPDTADGTGATPCFSAPVTLWPGAAAVLRSPIYPADRPTVIVDNPNGTQTEWSVTDFRGMLYRGIDLVVAATSPIPDASGLKAIDRINADAQKADAFARGKADRTPPGWVVRGPAHRIRTIEPVTIDRDWARCQHGFSAGECTAPVECWAAR